MPENEHRWDRGWDEHEREQLRRMARLTLYERILWLEQAQEMVEHLKRQTPEPNPSADQSQR